MGVEGTTTSAMAEASGYSVQQVRDLEALGVIAAASRTASGHRRFAATHLRQLLAYRDLALAVGPVDARRVLAEIRTLAPAEAVARVGALHIGLHREREQLLAARAALVAIGEEAVTDARATDADAMTITELSGALGVRPSALRFWEREGLLQPEHLRTRSGTARRYRVAAIRQARIVVALRAAGHRICEVAAALEAITELGEVETSIAVLDERADLLTRRWHGLLRAGATLTEILGPSLSGASGTGGGP